MLVGDSPGPITCKFSLERLGLTCSLERIASAFLYKVVDFIYNL
jgi:hypothetical protein